MNRHGIRFGVISCLFAAAAIVLAVTEQHFNSIQGAVAGYVLQWFDQQGLVRPPNHASYPEWSNPGRLVLTDTFVAYWLAVHSCWFAACSVLFAMWAESRHEATLPLSAGFVLGAMALVFQSHMVSVATLLTGGACMLWLRRPARNRGSG